MIRKFSLFLLLVLGSFSLVAQNDLVSGVITSAEDGAPLPGVNVLVQGSTTGTQTDFDGNYQIEANEADILVFSYIGTKTQSIPVGPSSTIDVVLVADANELDEVVVTALGIQRQKKSLSYSTQSVDTEELTKARSLNVVNGLSGKVAGLSVTSGSSGVGSSSKVLLRGNRSINGSSQPLYVVDGILLNGDISNISPDDIQDISVLKGANAAALYGSRANNGAIIVTTKSGKGSKEGVSTSLGFTSTFADPIFLLEYQNEFGQGSAGSYAPAATTSWGPRFDGSQVAHWSNNPDYPLFGQTYAYEAQPNNVEDLFRLGHELATNLSVNINSEKSNVFLGYTFTDAGGIIPGNDLNRHSLSARVNSNVTDKLMVDAKINYIRDDFANVLTTGEAFDNPLRYSYILPRNIRTEDLENYQFRNADNKLRQHYFLPQFNGGGNPYWSINNVIHPRLNERVLGLLSLKYQFTDAFSIMGRSTIDRTSTSEDQKWFNDTYTEAQNGRYQKRASNSFDWNTDVLLNFNKDLSENFSIDINAGANNRTFRFDELTGNGANFTIENFFALSNTLDPTATERFDRFEVNSVYGLAELSFKNAIFLNATARNDWSSTLPENNRSYFYPSVGLTAVISDLVEFGEGFNFLKLRGSWAEVGNDTNAFSLFRRADILNGTLRLNPNDPIPDLRPESTISTEFGFDTRFFNNRLRLDFTYYKTNTSDQIFRTPAPSGSGISSKFQNGGDIQNTGVEIALGATLFNNPDFSWDLDLNFSKNQSEVLEITSGFDELVVGNADFIREYRLVKGQPFGDVYSRGFLRDDQGRVQIDANGLPLTTTGLDVLVSNYNPDWLGGIRNSLTYKNFNFSVLVDIRQGGSVTSFTEAILARDGLLDYTVAGRDGSLVFGENIFEGEAAVLEGTDTPNNLTTNSEAFWNRVGGRNAPVGEAFKRDASNIRVREMVLGYSVPDKFLENNFFTSASFSLVGRNLFFISNKAGNFDPETLSSVSTTSNATGNGEITSEGTEAFAPPTTRTIGVSLNFGF
ncbi:MAG TPA: SusC/RagA family TonB-linked outer membrane protein [Pricia antarctica]|uniref:SusC/RagA family TonB-linked outer membrane protein n=3 Tax=root TaxID=1 RepID=A0A831VRG7_9FLAO|nr:SusC/RagA family TonB-linked outer membrane protein [Pricia antarctica]